MFRDHTMMTTAETSSARADDAGKRVYSADITSDNNVTDRCLRKWIVTGRFPTPDGNLNGRNFWLVPTYKRWQADVLAGRYRRGVESSTHFDPESEARRDEVLKRLEATPGTARAFLATPQRDRSYLVTVAIRGVGTGELTIPAGRLSGPKDLAAFLECMAGQECAP